MTKLNQISKKFIHIIFLYVGQRLI